MRNKTIALVTATFFLLFYSACSHMPKSYPSLGPKGEISSQKEIYWALNESSDEEKWWKKPENEFMILLLIILGVAIVAGASILIVSSSGGLTVGVHD
jgi:hypothetical protein